MIALASNKMVSLLLSLSLFSNYPSNYNQSFFPTWLLSLSFLLSLLPSSLPSLPCFISLFVCGRVMLWTSALFALLNNFPGFKPFPEGTGITRAGSAIWLSRRTLVMSVTPPNAKNDFLWPCGYHSNTFNNLTMSAGKKRWNPFSSGCVSFVNPHDWLYGSCNVYVMITRWFTLIQ